MRNNKGFTLVELLAVIAIMGIILGISIQAYSIYKDKSVKQSYDTMSLNSANAAEEYFMDHMADTSVEIDVLVEEEYLSRPVDPKNSNVTCTGVVTKLLGEKKSGEASAGKGVDLIPLQVELTCSNYTSCMKYPDKTEC